MSNGMVQNSVLHLYKSALRSAIAVHCKCTAETKNPLKTG